MSSLMELGWTMRFWLVWSC